MFRRLLPLLALFAIATLAPAQAITGADRDKLLSNARAQYYNLHTLGMKSFGCNVEIDWDGLFKQVNGAPLPADHPMMVYLSKSRLGLKETVASGATVEWANTGTPPDSIADSADKLRGGLKQMLEGFFQAWTPNINGDLFAKEVASVTATPTGYVVTEKNSATDTDMLTFDKDLLLSHMSTKSTDETSEIDMKYLKTPQGWLLADMQNDFRQPVSDPPTHMSMSSDYQTVDGFQIPGTIVLNVGGVGEFHMKLTGCTVEKLAQ